MEKTPFAGLTLLDPAEALSTDGYSFQHESPSIIDRYLEVAAVSHRHDAHAALADPTDAPTVVAGAGGGAILASRTIFATYTLLDADGGETRPVAAELVTTAAPIDPPDAGPPAALDTTGGTLLANTYMYALTFTDGNGGETTVGPSTMVQRPTGPANARVQITGLTAILTAAGAAGWRLWRSVGGGRFGFVAAGATDTYTDDGSSSPDCTMSPPTTNTTNGVNTVQVTVPSGQDAEAVQFRVYLSDDGSFDSPAVAGTYPIADTGTVKTYTSLDLADGTPPDVSRSLPGANQINASTDIAGLDAATFPGPQTAVVTAAALANNASSQVTIPMAEGFTVYRVVTSVAARVRLYPSAAYQAADVARAYATPPTGDHGVLLDAQTTGGDLDIASAPPAPGLNFAGTVNVPITITNLSGGTVDVTVTLTYIRNA